MAGAIVAEWSCPTTLVTPGPDITFNATSGDRYLIDPEQSRFSTDSRVTADPSPQDDGAIVFPVLEGAGHFVLVVRILPSTDTAAGRNTMIENLASALEAIRTADGTYQQTPSGGSLRGMAVRKEISLGVAGTYRKVVTFGLIAADPTWS